MDNIRNKSGKNKDIIRNKQEKQENNCIGKNMEKQEKTWHRTNNMEMIGKNVQT